MNNENMNSNDYYIFTIDEENKRIFVTRKPIVTKDKDEKKRLQIDKHLENIDFHSLPITNPDFRASDCEIVDITDWNYNDLEDLWYQIRSYASIKRI